MLLGRLRIPAAYSVIIQTKASDMRRDRCSAARIATLRDPDVGEIQMHGGYGA